MEINCVGFFDRIKDLLAQSNFRGYLSEGRVKEDLEDMNTTSKRKRHYIIRYSLQTMGEFILSFTAKEKRLDDPDVSTPSLSPSMPKTTHRDFSSNLDIPSSPPPNGDCPSPSKAGTNTILRIEHWHISNQGGKLALHGKKYSTWKDLLTEHGFVDE